MCSTAWNAGFLLRTGNVCFWGCNKGFSDKFVSDKNKLSAEGCTTNVCWTTEKQTNVVEQNSCIFGASAAVVSFELCGLQTKCRNNSKDTLPLGSQDISLRKKTVVSIKDPFGLQIVQKRNLCEAKRPFHSWKPFFALVFKRLFLAEIT